MRIALAGLAFLLAAPVQAADGTFAVAVRGAAGEVGAKLAATVTIQAKQGWHLNHEAPLTLKLNPVPGVAVDKPKLAREDLAFASETEARFTVALILAEPGPKAVEAEAGFVLCRQDACRPIKEKLTLAAEATAAKTAPAAKKPVKKHQH
jgi:hypothetical protein